MSPTVPQAVQSCHEMLLWLIPQLDKFPRMGRGQKTPSFILRRAQDERTKSST